MSEQRNSYKGSPPRPWVRLVLVAADGTQREIEALADTGNPCALVVGPEMMRQFNQGLAPGMSTNFGPLDGGWLQVQIPEIGFDENVLAYASDAVAHATAESHADFQALAGLPLLKRMEYGGDRDAFWVRTL
jgi:hypothetical protein